MALTRPKFNNIDSTIVKISDAVLTVNEGNATQQTMGIAFDRSGWSLDSVGLIWNYTTQQFEFGTLSSNGVSVTAPSITGFGNVKANTFTSNTVIGNILISDSIQANTLSIADLELITNSDTDGYELFLTRSRGTASFPTAVQTGDEIFTITGNARNAIDYNRVVSIQSFSTGTNSANLKISLHDGTSLDTKLTLDSNGDLTIAGNITGGNIISDGYFYSNGTPLSGGGSSYADSDVVNLLNNFGSNVITTSGNVTVGNFELTGTVTGNIVPSANAVYNLGSPTNRFNTLYLVGNTIDLGGATISADGDEGVVAIIPQVKSNQTTTKAILIGDSGVATADTDNFGRLSKSAIQEAMSNRVTVTGSLIANTLITTEGNIVGGNLKTDGLTIVRGIQSLGEYGITSGGNIQAPYFLGNGSLLTGLGNHYQDSDVANLLADLGPTSISTNSNITGNIITATRFVGNGSELTGITSSITVSEIDSGNTLSNSVGSITTLSFDIDSGFAVDDVGNGIAKVRTNSTFKTIVVDGQGNLVAQGLDTLEIISGNGISIITNPNSDPKSLTISGTYGDSNVSSLLTNYATTSYVDTELANLVASAPSTLDTLNELASALGNDAAFSTSITNLIGNNTSNIATIQSQITALEANTHANLESNVTTLESQVSNLNYYDDSNVTTFLSDIGSNTIVTTGNVTAGNIEVTSNVTGSYFFGNGSQLTGISASAVITVANAAPSSPNEGDVWIDTTDGVQYIYFNDGDSLQWVDMQSTIVNVGGGGYGDSDVLDYLGSVAGNIVPAANVTYNLGSETQRWNTLYLAGNTIDLGGAQIKADPSAGTIALIPQVKQGQTKTKAIVIGSRGISTVDTDTDGNVSADDIAAASTSANTTTGNINATGVTVTNSLTVNTTVAISGDIASNINPSTNVTYTLGNSTHQWHSLYVGPGSLYVNNKKVIEDDSGRITVSTSENQNLAIKTSGSGDIEIFPTGTGVINLQGNVQADSGVILSGTGGLKFGSNLNLDNNNINNLDDPVQAQDAATKAYVDAVISSAQGNYSNSNVATYLTEYTGNVTAGNIISDNIFFSNGDPFVSGGGATVTVSDSPPADPSVGDIWFNGSLGVEFLYINDGDSSQWVETKTIVYQYQSYGDSDVATYLTEYTGNVTAGNILTDNYFYANGEAFVSGGGSSYDEESTSTGFFGIPAGTTAQRPVTPNVGMVRYNTTVGAFEFYSSSWVQISGLGISSVTPNSFTGNSGTSFTISGNGFVEGTSVKFSTANGSLYSAGTVIINNLNSISATTPRAFTVAEEPLGVQVIAPGGITAALTGVIDCGGSPTWTTNAGSLGTAINNESATFSISATDPDNETVTYSVSLGTLPTGLSLDANTGNISGTVAESNSYTSSGVTYNFDIAASDTNNQSERSFSIITKWRDGSTSDLAAPDALSLAGYGITDNGLYYINLGNSQGAQQVYCVMDTSYDGGGWMVWYGTPAGATSQTYRVSADRDDATTASPLVGNYSLSYAKRSGIRAICSQTQSMVGRHHATDKLWLRLNNYIWNSTTHSSGNFNFETLMTAVSSTGSTDSSVDVGLINTAISGGGDFGIAVDTLDHHNTSTYYNLNGSCSSQYLYQYGAGYKATDAFTGFNTTTSGCDSGNSNAFGFWIGMR